MTSILPCVVAAGGVMNRFVSRYTQTSRQYIADGGNIAEEVLSTIRTAQAFGTQNALATLYDMHVDKSIKVEITSAVFRGGSFATFFFVLYSAYGLAFSFGTTLINEGHGKSNGPLLRFLLILFLFW
jgi:ATP-binding cassette subfamily B (MDR/TAP) protein 1